MPEGGGWVVRQHPDESFITRISVNFISSVRSLADSTRSLVASLSPEKHRILPPAEEHGSTAQIQEVSLPITEVAAREESTERQVDLVDHAADFKSFSVENIVASRKSSPSRTSQGELDVAKSPQLRSDAGKARSSSSSSSSLTESLKTLGYPDHAALARLSDPQDETPKNNPETFVDTRVIPSPAPGACSPSIHSGNPFGNHTPSATSSTTSLPRQVSQSLDMTATKALDEPFPTTSERGGMV